MIMLYFLSSVKWQFSNEDKAKWDTRKQELVDDLINTISQKYEIFPDWKNNTIIYKKETLDIFILYYTISLNIEISPNDNTFLIHLRPEIKIGTEIWCTIDFFKNFKNIDNKFKIKIYDIKNRRRNDFSSSSIDSLKHFYKEDSILFWSFDFHFIKNYNENIFNKINSILQKNVLRIKDIIWEIIKILDILQENNKYNLDKKLLRIEPKKISKKANIMIWSYNPSKDTFTQPKIYEKQSWCFHCGVFKPTNCSLQVIEFWFEKTKDTKPWETFIKLFKDFNKGGNTLIHPILRADNIDILKENLEKALEKHDKNLWIMFLCKNKMPDSFFQEFIFKHKTSFKYQITLETPELKFNERWLSNTVVQFIKILWWIPWQINDLFIDESSYFIGIKKQKKNKETKYYVNLYDCKWNNVFYKWQIQEEKKHIGAWDIIKEIFDNNSIKKILKNSKHLIIHKEQNNELNNNEEILKTLWEIAPKECIIDIVNIIQDEYPMMCTYENDKYNTMHSWEYRKDENKKYGILITSDQKEEGIPRPIIIKHQCWNTPLDIIIEQIYRLTKTWTRNLFFGTRLPITIKK